MKESRIPRVRMRSGIEIPQIGLGVYKAGVRTEAAVLSALETGYRHIDTASFYRNEADVGRAIKSSGLRREDIFLTSKIWNDEQRSGEVRAAFYRSLERLETDYLDLYLIHWPVSSCFERTWESLQRLKEEGLVRALGVSNFLEHHLDAVQKTALPEINQIELHPYAQRRELVRYCLDRGILICCWSPLARTRCFSETLIQKIAANKKKSESQIVLRFALQKGYIVIPKSVHPERQRENIDLFDFSLSSQESAEIESLNREELSHHPDHILF